MGNVSSMGKSERSEVRGYPHLYGWERKKQ